RVLVHPGLVVRRITAGVIRPVLAGPCGLTVTDDAQASALFERLKAGVSLVEEDPSDGALVHLTYVRRLLLPAIRAEKPAQVAEIHRAAIQYYGGRDAVRDRAEEIYHRLSLGQSGEEIERRWTPDLLQYLQGSLEELEGDAKVFLAGKLDVTI